MAALAGVPPDGAQQVGVALAGDPLDGVQQVGEVPAGDLRVMAVRAMADQAGHRPEAPHRALLPEDRQAAVREGPQSLSRPTC